MQPPVLARRSSPATLGRWHVDKRGLSPATPAAVPPDSVTLPGVRDAITPYVLAVIPVQPHPMPTNRSLASLAKQLERAIPEGFPPFDAAAYLNGTYKLPTELQNPPLPDLGEQNPYPGVRDRAPGRREEQGVRDHLPAFEDASRVTKDTSEDTSPSESEVVTSGVLKTPKKCRGTNKQGGPCGAYPLRAGDLCLYHEADAVTNLRDAQSRGGQGNARRPIMDLETLALDLHHRLDLQAMLETILRAQLSGALPARRGAQLLRNLGIAERNLSSMHRDAHRSRESRDCESYERIASTLVGALPVIIENFEAELDAERARAIEDTGARREQYLRANERFGHNQPKPASEVSPAHPRFRPPNPFTNHPFLQH